MKKGIHSKCFRGSVLAMALLASCLLAPRKAFSYITSAILEFSADDTVALFLNGSTLLERSGFGPFDYDVLSTADGTLPLELFKENDENILGVENFDTRAGNMCVSFRLTVYHSDGDPVVIWSVPEDAKMLHLPKEQKGPIGWTERTFDDSKWIVPYGVHLVGDWIDFPLLEDPAFATTFGTGYVPFLSHRQDGMCRGGDHNLFRCRFRFPNHPAKVEAVVSPAKASYGQSLTVRLIPGPDTTELSQFNLMAWLPKNVELGATAPGAQYDSDLRRLSWRASRKDMNLGYEKLHAVRIVSAGTWGAPQKFLGPEKAGKEREQLNTPDSVYNDAAIPTQGGEGWFKVGEPSIDFSKGVPKIQGVLFRSQLRIGGQDKHGLKDVDHIYFNYSVDGRTKGALRRDVDITHVTGGNYWIDGYYHATEDRHWTWDDIKNLMVMYKARQIGQRDKNLLASMTCIVRYYYPSKVAPWFQAKVLEPRCSEVQLQTGVFRYGSKLNPSDPLIVKVNEQLCAPSPVPTLTWTPVPIALARPQPTSTPAPKRPEGRLAATEMGLGCVTVSPNPVDYGGTFISFCLKAGASVTVNIYDASGGRGLRRIEGGAFRPGDNQIFFNALDDSGKLMLPGNYICELVARKENSLETRNTVFTVVKKRQRR
ncbi:MAG: hypothetical protein V4498_09435 [candidate division FCPU426 bacterium]